MIDITRNSLAINEMIIVQDGWWLEVQESSVITFPQTSQTTMASWEGGFWWYFMLGSPNKSKGHLGGRFSDISTKKCSPQPKNEQFASVCFIHVTHPTSTFFEASVAMSHHERVDGWPCGGTRWLYLWSAIYRATLDKSTSRRTHRSTPPKRNDFCDPEFWGHFQKDDKWCFIFQSAILRGYILVVRVG